MSEVQDYYTTQTGKVDGVSTWSGLKPKVENYTKKDAKVIKRTVRR